MHALLVAILTDVLEVYSKLPEPPEEAYALELKEIDEGLEKCEDFIKRLKAEVDRLTKLETEKPRQPRWGAPTPQVQPAPQWGQQPWVPAWQAQQPWIPPNYQQHPSSRHY